MKYKITLSKNDQEALEKFVKTGKKSAREISRARILLLLNEKKKEHEIEKLLGISRCPIQRLRKRYIERKGKNVLEIIKDDPRSGAPIKVDSEVEANISMIACSKAPDGRKRWTLHMIADKLVKLNSADICHETVRKTLKKTN